MGPEEGWVNFIGCSFAELDVDAHLQSVLPQIKARDDRRKLGVRDVRCEFDSIAHRFIFRGHKWTKVRGMFRQSQKRRVVITTPPETMQDYMFHGKVDRKILPKEDMSFTMRALEMTFHIGRSTDRYLQQGRAQRLKAQAVKSFTP